MRSRAPRSHDPEPGRTGLGRIDCDVVIDDSEARDMERIDCDVVDRRRRGIRPHRRHPTEGRRPLGRRARGRDRAGGRLWTDEVDGAMLEIGGQWVSPDQDALIETLDDLGLETYPRYREGVNIYIGPDGELKRFEGEIFPVPPATEQEIVTPHRQARRARRRDRPRPSVGAPAGEGPRRDLVRALARDADRRRGGAREHRHVHRRRHAHQARARVLGAAGAAHGGIRGLVLEPRRRRLHPRPPRRRRPAAGAAAARRAPRRRGAPRPGGAHAALARRMPPSGASSPSPTTSRCTPSTSCSPSRRS